MKNTTFSTALLSFAFATSVVAADKKDIVETAAGAGSFKTLAAALDAAGLVDTLKGAGPFTVFAPTDEAFAKLPEGTVKTLLKPENREQLIDILTYHVVSGEVPFSVAAGLDKAETLNKKSIAISVTGGTLTLNESKVIENDIACTNGIIHVIDTVLLPPAPETRTSQTASDLIRMAIGKGARLYNHGQHEASAAIYQVTAKALMTMPEGAVTGEDRAQLEKAMKACAHSHCATTNAWTMRHALDRVLASNTR